MKKNGMVEECDTWGRAGRIQGFCVETWGKETTWKALRRLENNIKMDSKEIC